MKVVDLRPELNTVSIQPTRGNPDIKVVIGNDNGKYVPKQLLYPDHMSEAEVREKAERYQAQNGCPLCKRFKATEQAKMAAVIIGLGVGIALVVIIFNRRKK